MPHEPAPDVIDDLKMLAANPYWLTNAELKRLIERAIEEIEVLRLVVRDAEDASGGAT